MRKTHLAIGLAALAAATVLLPGTANAVSNPPGGGGGGYQGSSLSRGESLYPGEYIQRLNNDGNRYLSLVMQSDGNLVEYVSADTLGGPYTACWASGTNGSGATRADYQSDGNFVVYTSNNAPVWASDTQWKAGSTVDINWDGIVYVGTTPISNACR